MMCLICNQVVKTVKGDNAKQHSKLKEDSRKICIDNLKKSVRKQTACTTTFFKSTNSRCEASYRVTYHLGVAGKPYSNGELLKRCLIDVVKCIHPGRKLVILQLFSCVLQCNAGKMMSLSMLQLDLTLHACFYFTTEIFRGLGVISTLCCFGQSFADRNCNLS